MYDDANDDEDFFVAATAFDDAGSSSDSLSDDASPLARITGFSGSNSSS
jgi:hypothetical protein